MSVFTDSRVTFSSIPLEKNSHNPIGMFDSGLGGLTVMREVMALLPSESIHYFGDTAHFPYGNQSYETIISYSTEIAKFLVEQSIKLLVIACNTASACALEALQQLYPIPIVDVINAGVEKALRTTQKKTVVVLGTKNTIASRAYQRKLYERMPEGKVWAIPCPLLAPLVEEQFSNHPAASLIIKEYLKPLANECFDTLLLGCTHYPFLAEQIQAIVGKNVQIIDSGSACAEKVKEVLEASNQLNLQAIPSHQFFVSSGTEEFRKAGEIFLKTSIHPISLVPRQLSASKNSIVMVN